MELSHAQQAPCAFWYRKLERNKYPKGEELKRIIEDSKSKEDKRRVENHTALTSDIHFYINK